MTKQPDFSEKDFIRNQPKFPLFSSFIWIGILFAIAAFFWLGGNWIADQLQLRVVQSPFLQVTNREISLYLWQNPEHMRLNAKVKTGYLPGFHSMNRATLIPDTADEWATVPPEILFRYHTWTRLIKNEWAQTAIPASLFRRFLEDAEAWQPEYWDEAPQGYIELVQSIEKQTGNLATLPETELPLIVRHAFQGWMNYYIQGEAINEIQPTYGEMKRYLQTFPHYDRNYWKNIVGEEYLKSYTMGAMTDDQPIPLNELSSFLRVNYFNWQRSASSAKTAD